MLKKKLNKYFSHFNYFYEYLGYRIFLSLILSFSVGLLDGFGLAMFLPLLQIVTGEANSATTDGMGGMEFIVDSFQALGVSMTLDSVLIIIIIFFSFKGMTSFIRQYYEIIIKIYFIKKIRFKNIDGLANFSYKAFIKADTGRVQNTLSGEVSRVNAAYTAYFSMLQAIIMVLVYMSLAFLTNPQFALLVVLGGLLSNLAYQQIYKKTKAISAKITRGGHRFQRQLIQFVSHFKYLKSTALLDHYSRKLKKSIIYVLEADKKIGFYNSVLSATREPLNITVVAIVIIVQVNFFSAALSGIILALLFFYRALNYVMSLQTAWNSFLNVSGSLDNMTAFNRELQIDAEKYGSKSQDHYRGELQLKELSFFYGETQVLNNISLHIEANTSIALVGESGSGKTTLVNLISGLVRPNHGSICVDGINYEDIDIRSLQKRIGYISQDSVIFSESIYDNISLWAEPTEENIQRFWHACEKAAIVDFIQSLPQGMETPLGNNGIQLSGGQKQRISIARELFKDVSIVIRDEGTSALDSMVEREIQNNIDALKGQYTIIIVAHRLSTIQNVDQIYLMNKGEIENSGDFWELHAKSKRFKEMVKLQEF